MGLSSWLHAKINKHSDLIILLGILSAIFTILGINMPSLLSPFADLPTRNFSSIALFLNTLITLYVIYWGLSQKKKFGTAKRAIADLRDFIIDLNEYPYNNGRMFERENKLGLRAAIAKNGIIPHDSNAIITKLNEKDTNLGKRFGELEGKLKTGKLID